MSKRRLTQQQTSRIQARQSKLLAKTRADDQEMHLSDEQWLSGLVVAHYGTYVDVEDEQGAIYRCHLRQNLGVIVVGDKVTWRPHQAGNGILVASQPRHSLLTRPISAGKNKAIAANVDQMIIVFAVQPRAPQMLLDSYLVAAESLNISVMLVLNKMDLLIDTEAESLSSFINIYQRLNYSVLQLSVQQQQGIKQLQAVLQNHTSVLVGQSGVGKSSLLACLLPENILRIATHEGTHATHTTTTARLYHLPNGGDVIDSPGVRDFQLWDMTAAQIAYGFVEFRAYLGLCRFRDCLHLQATGCALHAAVDAGEIHHERLQSYQRLVQEFALRTKAS